jgi:membrane protein
VSDAVPPNDGAGGLPPPAPAAPAPAPPAERAAGGGSHPARARPAPRRKRLAPVRDFVRRVYNSAAEDNIFFMGGAIAFNILVAIVPLILATLGIAGLVIRARSADPGSFILGYVDEVLPGALAAVDETFVTNLRNGLNQLIEQSSGLLSLSTLFFIWVATRLVGTLRTALREIFDINEDRGIVRGKIFDIQMVIAAGTLLAINVLFTIVLNILARYGVDILGIDTTRFQRYDRVYANAVAFLSIWFMFVLTYRYLPARRIQWRIAMIAATFTGVLFEVTKTAFTWYVGQAEYGDAYGNFATIIVLFLWIYYMSVIYILGGEVGQVAAMARVRKRQKERLG